jgi:ribonuclease T1
VFFLVRLALFSRRLALVALGWGALACTQLVHSRSQSEALDRSVVALAALPPEGQQTYRLIHQGGPFPYDKDGSVFGNRERQLPRQDRGFYREYTVKTPGAKDRGARRIVCGGEVPKRPEACYYTEDHYASFRMIVQTRN